MKIGRASGAPGKGKHIKHKRIGNGAGRISTQSAGKLGTRNAQGKVGQ